VSQTSPSTGVTAPSAPPEELSPGCDPLDRSRRSGVSWSLPTNGKQSSGFLVVAAAHQSTPDLRRMSCAPVTDALRTALIDGHTLVLVSAGCETQNQD
jgi:hypothetical protein